MSFRVHSVVLLAEQDYRLDWIAFGAGKHPLMDQPDCLFDERGEEVMNSVVSVSQIYDVMRDKGMAFRMRSGVVQVAKNLREKFMNASPRKIKITSNDVEDIILPFLDKLLGGEDIPYTMADKTGSEDDPAVQHVKLVSYNHASIAFATFDADHNPVADVDFDGRGHYVRKRFTACYSPPQQVFDDNGYKFAELTTLTRVLVKIQSERGVLLKDWAVREALKFHMQQYLQKPDDHVKKLEVSLVQSLIDQTSRSQTQQEIIDMKSEKKFASKEADITSEDEVFKTSGKGSKCVGSQKKAQTLGALTREPPPQTITVVQEGKVILLDF